MRVRSPGSYLTELRDGWQFLTTRYLVASGAPLIVAQVATGVLGLARNALLARFLAKEHYGALNYLLSGLSLLALLGLPGLSVAIAQYTARGHWEAIRLGLRRRLLFASLPMITLVAVGWMGVQRGQDDIMPPLWFLTALFFPTAQVLRLIGGTLGALKRFRSLAWYRIGESAAFLLATAIALRFWPAPKTTGVVLLQWLLVSLLNIWFWARLRRPKSEPIPLSASQRAQFYAFGTHMTILGGLGELRARVGGLLLGSFISLSSLADYAIGALFFEQMRAIWNIYCTVSYPRLINLNAQDRWRQVGRETRLATPAFAALSCVGGIGLSLVVPWLFSEEYMSSLPYIWILLVAFVCSIPGGFFEMFFRLEESERALYRIRLVSDVAGVLLPPLMLVLWGPWGVPAGRASASLVYSAVGFILYRRAQRK